MAEATNTGDLRVARFFVGNKKVLYQFRVECKT